MIPLTRAELEAAALAVEAALDRTPEVDRWCSGPDWVLPVSDGFAPDARPILLRTDAETPGYALLARYRLEDGRSMIAGLEPLWGFASPLIGPDPLRLAEELCRFLSEASDWSVLVLPGIPTPTGPDSFAAHVVRGLAPLGQVKAGDGMTRQVADLRDGFDCWFSRRSQRFRRNLRRATRRAEEAGLVIAEAEHEPFVFDRLLAIERASWKGVEGSGITSPEMTTTYRAMVARLAGRRRLRVRIATLDGRDVGYILGGVRARRYRGLQISYTGEVEALSVGHLLQTDQLEDLCRSGVETYDLGMDLEYKQRWADRAESSITLVIERHGHAGGS